MSAIARLVMYLAVCLSTLVLRKRDREIAAQVGAHFTDPLQRSKPPTFTVPLGPVIPVLASLVALGILAGATQAHLIAGAAALAGGAVLFFLAPRSSVVAASSSEADFSPPETLLRRYARGDRAVGTRPAARSGIARAA